MVMISACLAGKKCRYDGGAKPNAEILARIAGAGVTTATGTYPINVTLPVGTALHVAGTQQVTTLTVSALNRSVSGRQYGDVAVVTTSYNRNHNGGTSDN